MYAIVEIAGKQYKAEVGKKIYIDYIPGQAGEEVSFDKVLLLDNGSVTVGTPTTGSLVKAKIEKNDLKSDKVIVFKKKRRKGYKVKNGHRQLFTQISVQSI
ncbi:MAG: 50S ribosomal protein L21 [Chitinophagales bacterium]|jgi:large subunit ribosomal protein L21|nr:50S ribosomal protein L21 [Chitinophagales bacterium]